MWHGGGTLLAERFSAQEVQEYLTLCRPNEAIQRCERVFDEFVLGEPQEVWLVETEAYEYFVVGPPLTWYPADGETAEGVFNRHLGLMTRLMALHQPAVRIEGVEAGREIWRPITQAREQLQAAEEVEDLQGIGARLRTSLLTLTKSLASTLEDADDEPELKRGDFVGWVAKLASQVAPGESGSAVRGHLNKSARATWDLVNWLRHSTTSSPLDAETAIDATQHVAAAVVNAAIKLSRGERGKCSACGSADLRSKYDPETNAEFPYLVTCASCSHEELWDEDPLDWGAEYVRCQGCGKWHRKRHVETHWRDSPLPSREAVKGGEAVTE